ncbi:hypothetical protein F5X99DRAFT_422104 [Biscogniauxia marginata]|nr:hypothetical protein F5X99DRAFT_422104 [Biscogniauxia marginata]
MPSLISVATATLLFANSIHAHFTVQYPPTVGPFQDDTESSAPCGGYSPNLDDLNATDFHVDGDSIATYSTHPQTKWLYRITTDPTASGNWSGVWGLIEQTGPGNYCTPAVTIPSEYVGQKAILSIVASGLDGYLYQCSAVNFVEGTGNVPEACFNRSGVTGTFTTDDGLTAQLDSSSSSSATPSATETPNAGVQMGASSVEGLGALMTVGIMVVVGAFLVI